MKASFSKDLVTHVDAGRLTRERYASKLLKNPEDIKLCLDYILAEDLTDGHKAAWILEIAVLQNFDLLLSSLNDFIAILPKIRNESSLRPMAKITDTLCQNALIEPKINQEALLSPKQKQKLLDVSFQWLITDQKTAVQVFAMQIVYNLGQDITWVHAELKLTLEQKLSTASAGYRSRAKKILLVLEKKRTSA